MIYTGQVDSMTYFKDSRIANCSIRLPSVSVILTCYNYETYITQCLHSIKNQTYQYFKCFIIDDCSADDSVKEIENFIESNDLSSSYTLIRHQKNQGQLEAFRTGLASATGTFIVFVDADDLLLEDFLENHIQIHLSNKTVAFTCSNQYQINEKNEMIASNHPGMTVGHKKRLLSPEPLSPPVWYWSTTSAMMFRKSILDLIFPIDTSEFKICADNYLCHFSNLLGGSLIIPGIYGCYRRHGHNNFSDNPIIGRSLPIGNIENQPSHMALCIEIYNHLINNHVTFIALLSKWEYVMTLSRVLSIKDFIFLKNNHRNIFKNYSSLAWPLFVGYQIVEKTIKRMKIFMLLTKNKLFNKS